MALALIEDVNIPAVFEHLRKVYVNMIRKYPYIKKLFAYFDKQWIRGFHSPDKWSCYNQECRTNNELESWNRQIWKFGSSKRHNLYSLGSLLHKDAIQMMNKQKYKHSAYIKKTQIDKNEKIQKAWDKYKLNPDDKYTVLNELANIISQDPKLGAATLDASQEWDHALQEEDEIATDSDEDSDEDEDSDAEIDSDEIDSDEIDSDDE